MKYPIGIQSFEKSIEDGYVYVDKTDLVYKLVTEGQDIVTQKRGSSFSNSMQPFRYTDLSPMS